MANHAAGVLAAAAGYIEMGDHDEYQGTAASTFAASTLEKHQPGGLDKSIQCRKMQSSIAAGVACYLPRPSPILLVGKYPMEEEPSRRDIALYVSDPHVVVSLAPQEVFLDPSHTFRLWLDRYRPVQMRARGFNIRLLNSQEDAEAVHNLYIRRHMVPPDAIFSGNTGHPGCLPTCSRKMPKLASYSAQ